MVENLLQLWIALWSGVNLYFALVMWTLFIGALLVIGFKWQGRYRLFAKNAPTFLTSIGIFGTFLGIALSLLHFDGTDIRGQINEIISGMQTAFLTSVLGVFLSIVLKVFLIIAAKQDNGTDMEAETWLQRFIGHIENSEQILDYHKQSYQKMDELVRAIGQDGDNSLIGQFRLMRMDMIEHAKQLQTTADQQKENLGNVYKVIGMSYKQRQAFENKLWQELDKVSETLAKSATETIMQALKDIITDFNNNLTEQFGENFKELNRAVHELVTWQDNYRVQIAQMIEQYRLGIEAINNTKTAIGEIEQSASVIPSHMNELNDVIKLNQANLDELGEHLEAFAGIRQKAVDSLPQINEHINRVLNNMTTASNDIKDVMIQTANTFAGETTSANNHVKNTADIIKNRSQEINELLFKEASNIKKSVEIWQNDFTKALQQLQKNFDQALKDMVNEEQEQIRKLRAEIHGISKQAWSDVAEDVKQLLEKNHQDITNKQTQALTSLGESLVSITRQFTTDYQRLVNEMDKVVRGRY